MLNFTTGKMSVHFSLYISVINVCPNAQIDSADKCFTVDRVKGAWKKPCTKHHHITRMNIYFAPVKQPFLTVLKILETI